MPYKPLATIRDNALALPLDERAELARDLVASLDGPPEPDVTAQWDAELCRRINRLRRGQATLIDADDVIARVRARLAQT
ncbi:MAG: hypothetical protein GKR94_19390 [Gammaproteobacteria bacterium]|nr:hypothetical protein [Gammaproteobacteria bacterium]